MPSSCSLDTPARSPCSWRSRSASGARPSGCGARARAPALCALGAISGSPSPPGCSRSCARSERALSAGLSSGRADGALRSGRACRPLRMRRLYAGTPVGSCRWISSSRPLKYSCCLLARLTGSGSVRSAAGGARRAPGADCGEAAGRRRGGGAARSSGAGAGASGGAASAATIVTTGAVQLAAGGAGAPSSRRGGARGRENLLTASRVLRTIESRCTGALPSSTATRSSCSVITSVRMSVGSRNPMPAAVRTWISTTAELTSCRREARLSTSAVSAATVAFADRGTSSVCSFTCTM